MVQAPQGQEAGHLRPMSWLKAEDLNAFERIHPSGQLMQQKRWLAYVGLDVWGSLPKVLALTQWRIQKQDQLREEPESDLKSLR